MRARSLALWKALASVIGPDEILLMVALMLIARGLWLTWQPGAYLVPGVVILWIVLPSRRELVSRSSEQPAKPTPRKA